MVGIWRSYSTAESFRVGWESPSSTLELHSIFGSAWLKIGVLAVSEERALRRSQVFRMNRRPQPDAMCFSTGTCVGALFAEISVCDSFANPVTRAAFHVINQPDTEKNAPVSRYLWSRFRDFAHKWLPLYSFRMLTKSDSYHPGETMASQ